MSTKCNARLEVPGNRLYKAKHQGGGATSYNSNNSAPTLAHKMQGILTFIKRDETCYALLVHKSSPALIALGRLIESLFPYRWEEHLCLSVHIRVTSTRAVKIERLSDSLLMITDLCEPERTGVLIPHAVLITVLNKVQDASFKWFDRNWFPEQFIIEMDQEFNILIIPSLFK